MKWPKVHMAEHDEDLGDLPTKVKNCPFYNCDCLLG
jgi:hypothetical protein